MSQATSTDNRRPKSWRIATIASVGALLLGGAVALAPSASAVGSSACDPVRGDAEMFHTTSSAVHLRSGPGTRYTSLGLLTKNTNIWYICHKDTGPGSMNWAYGTVKSGAHKGKKGWTYSKYTTGGAA